MTALEINFVSKLNELSTDIHFSKGCISILISGFEVYSTELENIPNRNLIKGLKDIIFDLDIELYPHYVKDNILELRDSIINY